MSGHDAEIQHLKASVSCAALLERLPPVWRLDRTESTRRCLKYRANSRPAWWGLSCGSKNAEKV